MLALTKDVKFTRVSNAVAAGTTDVTATIDMAGFNGGAFAVLFGAITSTAVTSVKLGSGSASNGSDAVDLSNSSVTVADDDDNQMVVVELVDGMPDGDRYLTVTVDRGTANAVIDGIIAMQTNPKAKPVTQDASTVVGTALVTG